MSQLTSKQIANRAYYAKNAEKIKAQKRCAYQKTSKTKPAKTRIETVKNKVDTIPERPKPVRKAITQEDKTKLNIRRRIEDFKLAKELGIDNLSEEENEGSNR